MFFVVRDHTVFVGMIHRVRNRRVPEHPFHEMPRISVRVVPPQFRPGPYPHVEVPSVNRGCLRLPHTAGYARHHRRRILQVAKLLAVVLEQVSRGVLCDQHLVVPVQHRIQLKTHAGKRRAHDLPPGSVENVDAAHIGRIHDLISQLSDGKRRLLRIFQVQRHRLTQVDRSVSRLPRDRVQRGIRRIRLVVFVEKRQVAQGVIEMVKVTFFRFLHDLLAVVPGLAALELENLSGNPHFPVAGHGFAHAVALVHLPPACRVVPPPRGPVLVIAAGVDAAIQVEQVAPSVFGGGRQGLECLLCLVVPHEKLQHEPIHPKRRIIYAHKARPHHHTALFVPGFEQRPPVLPHVLTEFDRR